jgi:hypothetical protein
LLVSAENFARDKHSSLLQKFINYGKQFYNIGPGGDFKENVELLMNGRESTVNRALDGSMYTG